MFSIAIPAPAGIWVTAETYAEDPVWLLLKFNSKPNA